MLTTRMQVGLNYGRAHGPVGALWTATLCLCLAGCASGSATKIGRGGKSDAAKGAGESAVAKEDLPSLTKQAAADLQEHLNNRQVGTAPEAQDAKQTALNKPTPRNTSLRDPSAKKNTALAPRSAPAPSADSGTAASSETIHAPETPDGADPGASAAASNIAAAPSAVQAVASKPAAAPSTIGSGGARPEGAAVGTQGERRREFRELAAGLARSLRADPNGATSGALSLATLESFRPGTIADLESTSSELARELTAADFATLKVERDKTLTSVNAARTAARSVEVLAPDELAIRRAALCSRVDGFGRYLPFAGESFLVGRPVRAILYAELDNMKARPAQSGDRGFRAEAAEQFAVEVQQTVELYQDSTGLLVWRGKAKTTADVSQSKRADFFVVERIELPASLGVGKYRLKVSITDRTSKSIAETSLPINVVADAALVTAGEAR